MFDLQKILKRHWKILPFVCLSIIGGLNALKNTKEAK